MFCVCNVPLSCHAEQVHIDYKMNCCCEAPKFHLAFPMLSFSLPPIWYTILKKRRSRIQSCAQQSLVAFSPMPKPFLCARQKG